MNGHDYEYVVAQYLMGQGYTNVEVTKASGDYGIDVIANKDGHKYAVQCKYYSHPVGISAVQEVVAGKVMYGCDKAMVVTNSTYTNAAMELAQTNNVTLLSGVSSAKNTRVAKKVSAKNEGGEITYLIGCGIILFVVFGILSLLFGVLGGEQTVWNKIGTFSLFIFLGVLTAIIYIFSNRIFHIKNLLLKVILAFCSFLFSLWGIEGFAHVSEYLSTSSYWALFKMISGRFLAFAIVGIILFVFNSHPKQDKQ